MIDIIDVNVINVYIYWNHELSSEAKKKHSKHTALLLENYFASETDDFTGV